MRVLEELRSIGSSCEDRKRASAESGAGETEHSYQQKAAYPHDRTRGANRSVEATRQEQVCASGAVGGGVHFSYLSLFLRAALCDAMSCGRWGALSFRPAARWAWQAAPSEM